MNANEDFFETVLIALSTLEMTDVGEVPAQLISEAHEAWMLDDDDRRTILMDTAKQIVEQNVDLSTTFSANKSTETYRS